MASYTRLALGEQRPDSPRASLRTYQEHGVGAFPQTLTLAGFRLSQRFGLLPATAATVAALAGLGPQEVRR